jgi:hypothetical protein
LRKLKPLQQPELALVLAQALLPVQPLEVCPLLP